MSTRTGRVGDLICAAAIERVGGLASIVRTDGCDIIAYYDRRWFRVEVKSTVRPEQRGRKNHYYFVTSTGNGKKSALITVCRHRCAGRKRSPHGLFFTD